MVWSVHEIIRWQLSFQSTPMHTFREYHQRASLAFSKKSQYIHIVLLYSRVPRSLPMYNCSWNHRRSYPHWLSRKTLTVSSTALALFCSKIVSVSTLFLLGFWEVVAGVGLASNLPQISEENYEKSNKRFWKKRLSSNTFNGDNDRHCQCQRSLTLRQHKWKTSHLPKWSKEPFEQTSVRLCL